MGRLTAEELTEGIDARHLTIIVTGAVISSNVFVSISHHRSVHSLADLLALPSACEAAG